MVLGSQWLSWEENKEVGAAECWGRGRTAAFLCCSVLSCLLCLLFVWVVCFLKFVPFSTSVRLLGFFSVWCWYVQWWGSMLSVSKYMSASLLVAIFHWVVVFSGVPSICGTVLYLFLLHPAANVNNICCLKKNKRIIINM